MKITLDKNSANFITKQSEYTGFMPDELVDIFLVLAAIINCMTEQEQKQFWDLIDKVQARIKP